MVTQVHCNNIIIDTDLLIEETADAYHAKRGEYLTSHLLADFRGCPLLYHKKVRRQIPDPDSAAYHVGRATHVRILEGRDEYEQQFVFGGPINKASNKPFGSDTKAFKEWAAAQGKPGVHYDDHALIEKMAAGVGLNPNAVEFLIYGQAEGVVRTTYCGMPCQIRLDWVHPQRGVVDLKTCDNLTYFENDARRYGYGHQMAFYRAVLAQGLQLDPLNVPVHLIAVEKKEPFRCGVWRMGEEVLAQAQKDNEAAIKRLKRCSETNSWPTGYEAIRTFDWL